MIQLSKEANTSDMSSVMILLSNLVGGLSPIWMGVLGVPSLNSDSTGMTNYKKLGGV
jgi:hypothetical protein